MSSRILLTGASGFVGQRLAHTLIQKGVSLVCSARKPMLIYGAEIRLVDDLSADTDWRHCLDGVTTVIHCAARVHVMQDSATDPLHLYRQVNVAGTLQLAEQAAAAGATQFIFLSSIKVNGEETEAGAAFTEDCQAQPIDPYGISKFEAEQALFELGRKTGMAITVIRPPLVYGPGVGANFLSMMRWVKRGFPLPLGSIRNQRSFVFVDNLLSLITCCIENPRAYNQVFLASDGQDMSTTDLLKKSAAAFKVTSRLLPCPPSLLSLIATLAGKKSVADRLCQSLQVDISKARRQLEWSPPYTVEQGLQATANHIIEP
ncbi:MAG: SDR family oxidoreductase [Pseudomonadota bacterium]